MSSGRGWVDAIPARFFPWFVVDQPRACDVFAQWLDVRGWALSVRPGPLDVMISVDGRVLARCHADLPRPDLALAFPHLAHSGHGGFAARVPAGELPASPCFLLDIEISVPGPLSRLRRRSTRIPVRRSESAVPVVDRGDYATVWDARATSYDDARVAVCGTRDVSEHERSGESTAATLVRELQISKDDVVLEIGCGVGRIGSKLAPFCKQWIGADVSEQMLTHAAAALNDHGNVTFQKLHGSDLRTFANESVDVVYSSAVFMHLDEWDRYRYVAEAHRILRPGGRLYVDNMSLLGEEGWALFMELCELEPARRPQNISKVSTPDELRTYVERAGFKDVRLMDGPLWLAVAAQK